MIAVQSLTDVLAYVGTFVGGSAVLLGALSYLVKKWFEHGLMRDFANQRNAFERDLEGHKAALDRELQSHKAALDRASTAEADRLRHELELTAADVVKRTTLLNEKRAQVVAELYKLLIDFVFAAESFAAVAEYSGEPNKDQKAEILGKAASEFYIYFQHHRIYFSAKVCDGIQELFHAVHGPTRTFRMWQQLAKENSLAGEKHHLSWDKAWKAIQDDVPPLRNKIEAEFRALLGVTDAN
jgi:hypothetical protein